MTKKFPATFFCLITYLFLTACVSSGPKTEYYSLFPDAEINTAEHQIKNKKISFGVGPIVLPEYVDHPGIVSLNNSNRVTVSGYNAWAGNLKENIGRVCAGNLSAYWGLDQVWAFPWDNRVRPQYQVRMVFEDFSGLRGESVNLLARWTLLNRKADKVLLVGVERIDVGTSSASYNDYVFGLNQALNEFSRNVADQVAKELIIRSRKERAKQPRAEAVIAK